MFNDLELRVCISVEEVLMEGTYFQLLFKYFTRSFRALYCKIKLKRPSRFLFNKITPHVISQRIRPSFDLLRVASFND